MEERATQQRAKIDLRGGKFGALILGGFRGVLQQKRTRYREKDTGGSRDTHGTHTGHTGAHGHTDHPVLLNVLVANQMNPGGP